MPRLRMAPFRSKIHRLVLLSLVGPVWHKQCQSCIKVTWLVSVLDLIWGGKCFTVAYYNFFTSLFACDLTPILLRATCDDQSPIWLHLAVVLLHKNTTDCSVFTLLSSQLSHLPYIIHRSTCPRILHSTTGPEMRPLRFLITLGNKHPLTESNIP